MQHVETFNRLLFLVTVPTFVFILSESLHHRGLRVFMLCGFAAVFVPIGFHAWQHHDGSFSNLVVLAGLEIGIGLALIGLAAPLQFFWAFRALTAMLFLEIVGNLLSVIMLGDQHPAKQVARPPDLTTEAWGMLVVIGLPCLWFTWNGHPWPDRQRIHVMLREGQVPTADRWQEALDQVGFDLQLEGVRDLRAHSGTLLVVLQGATTSFQFDVAPVAHLVARHEIDDATAKRLGEYSLSANFRFHDDDERLAALVAAAALRWLTDGHFYDVEHDDWPRGDEAMEAAQDVVQPFELHVLLEDARVPTAAQWQQALNETGIDFKFQKAFDLRQNGGWLPILLRGAATGFAFGLSTSLFVVGGDNSAGAKLPPGLDKLDMSANFRFAGGPQRDAAEIAAAVLAHCTGGIVYRPGIATFQHGHDAMEALDDRLSADDST